MRGFTVYRKSSLFVLTPSLSSSKIIIMEILQIFWLNIYIGKTKMVKFL